MGIGLVWGWLLARHMLWLGRPRRTFLAVAATSVLLAGEVKLFVDWIAIAVWVFAVVLAASAHLLLQIALVRSASLQVGRAT